MEEKSSSSNHGSGDGVEGYWWWALASTTQAVTGVITYRRGRRIESSSYTIPFKAFFVASLIVGAGATAVAGCLNASGIHKIEDLKVVGRNLRNELRVPPRDTRK
ncbi:hypothetical protein IFM89_036717 [Coptis chinensis]|uniref:Uncharacterized protein n=1 Tax=Coptis chinensis TaxID=261450 RepID=A0A835M2R7_9MAGN|nr:hypothetical protein IFM89_036717 [Coptis chinensis]